MVTLTEKPHLGKISRTGKPQSRRSSGKELTLQTVMGKRHFDAYTKVVDYLFYDKGMGIFYGKDRYAVTEQPYYRTLVQLLEPRKRQQRTTIEFLAKCSRYIGQITLFEGIAKIDFVPEKTHVSVIWENGSAEQTIRRVYC